MITPGLELEKSLVTKLRDLKYEYRPDIRDRVTLEENFRKKFDALNRVTLTDGDPARKLRPCRGAIIITTRRIYCDCQIRLWRSHAKVATLLQYSNLEQIRAGPLRSCKSVAN